MPSYQYSKPNCGDKTVVRSSYLNNGIFFTGKITSLYWIRALVFAGLVENKLPIRILMNTALLIFPKQMFINSPRPEQNFWPFTVCFQKHLLETHCSYSLIQINCSPGTTKSALIPDIAWCQTGIKPLSERRIPHITDAYERQYARLL